MVLRTPTQPHNLTIRDIDQDGLPDIAVLSGHTRIKDVTATLSIYIQADNGTISPEQVVSFEGDNGYFSFHDLLEDGSLELVFGSSIYSFDLSGNLVEKFTFDNSQNGRIIVDDIDRNGHDDVMIGSDLFLRSEDGEFNKDPSISFEAFEYPLSVDIDGNGAKDIILGNSIYFQDLDGSFNMEDHDKYGILGSILWIEDLDRDGGLDLVSILQDDILIYYGDKDIDKDGFLDPFDWFPNDPSTWDPRGYESGIS
jgi:hypothetical protein